LNGSQTWMVNNGRDEMSGRYQLQEADGERVDGRQWGRGYSGKDAMGIGSDMAAAQTGVDFCWILDGLQVVRYGDDRKQDQNQHCEGDDLGSPAGVCVVTKPQPQADNSNGRKSPREIED
jgi:hypothetical protein